MASQRNRKSGSAFRYVICRYKASARIRGFQFLLTNDQCIVLFKAKCYYCGTEPHMIREQRTGEKFIYNGIDRLDSKKDYEITNCVPCCSQCNKMKQSYSHDSFIDKCREIANRHREITCSA